MTLEETKTAVREGKTVCWKSEIYVVKKKHGTLAYWTRGTGIPKPKQTKPVPRHEHWAYYSWVFKNYQFSCSR